MKYTVRVIDDSLDADQIMKFNNTDDLVNFITQNQHLQVLFKKYDVPNIQKTFEEFLTYWAKNEYSGKGIFYNIEITPEL